MTIYRRITVLLGGFSSERNVSIESGTRVAAALKKNGYDVSLLDVTRDLQKLIKDIKEQKPDAVFNALHGPFGEDGTIQGVLDWLSIPYTHSGVLASALAMRKDVARDIFQNAHLPVAQGKVINVKILKEAPPFPSRYVLKPLSEGSSVGVVLIDPQTTNMSEILQNWHCGEKALVEKFISGPEVTVGILDDKPLTITDITTNNGHSDFYDYHAKYASGQSVHKLPAKIPNRLFQQILDDAQAAHKSLGCRNVSRVDFKIDAASHKPFILEVNTQPGMTETSLLPEQAQYCGINYIDLCKQLIEKATYSQ